MNDERGSGSNSQGVWEDFLGAIGSPEEGVVKWWCFGGDIVVMRVPLMGLCSLERKKIEKGRELERSRW